MSNSYGPNDPRRFIREKTSGIVDVGKDIGKDLLDKVRPEVKDTVVKGAQFAGNVFQDAKTITKEEKYDPSAYVTAGAAYGLEYFGKGVEFLTNQIAQKTGIDPALVALGEMFVPYSKLGKLGKVSKFAKTVKVTSNLNDLKAFSFATKVDNLTGGNVKSEVMQMLSKTDNFDGMFQGSTLDTIKNIQKQYPITPLNPKVITPKEAKLRNQAMLKEGINVYKDELNMTWKRLGEGRWRNTTARNATRQKIDQITGLPGTRRDSTINYINKRSRDLVASNADEVKHVNSIYNSRDAINQRLNLVKGDRNFMTVEHRIGQSDWKKLGLEGNPHDSANLWLTTTHEAAVKTKIENTLRGKTIKGNYIVDFNPQNNALHVMKLENFKLNELPTGKRFKKNAKGDYNLQEIEKYLTTLK
tara:strand:- start:159 stop:1400 length:1242 start_codon:yes stop_codon:yes gene_type:complete